MSADDPIGAFYERFPYPPHLPGKTPKTLNWIIPSSLPEVAHFVFGGRLPRPLRVLVAGGGTGNTVLSAGGWMKRLGIAGAIDYVDLSSTSCAVAAERAAAAAIDNVSFRVAPLEALGEGPAGLYDYIDFCGVVNHVPDPQAALAALSHALAPGGGIGIMAYGRLGRTGVYEAQAALRMLGVDGGQDDAVARARAFVAGLPDRNWLKLNPGFSHLERTTDVELADVLLNPRDRAFTTDELCDLAEGAGLQVRCFCPSYLYNPAATIRDPALKAAAAALPARAQWRLAELLQGAFRKHVLYAVKPRPGAAAAPERDPVQGLLSEPDTLLVPAGAGLSNIAASVAGKAGQLVGIKFKVDGREHSVGTRFDELDCAIMGAIDGPTRVGEVLRRLSGREEDVVAGLRSLQPRLTSFRMLYVMAG